jgi:tetratricopeptide (TPR) repeat protein
MDSKTTKGNFVRSFLPWTVAAGMLLVYLVTLSHWVTLSSLPLLGQVAGWDWPKNNLGPLHFLVTYPFRWLPVSWLPVVLNLFAAICAALTLALLARSVALLPHDRTKTQRRRERSEFSLLSIRAAWLPPVLAVMVCGLQMTFWENAVAGTGELLNLLLFAYIVRCLLEFRISGRQSWLTRAALIYGAAMVNYWMVIAFLPLFLVVLVWIKGFAFFNLRFLTRMALAGLAGLSLCLVMPFVQSHSTGAPTHFWQALHSSLATEKNLLFSLSLRSLWVLGLTSILPLVVMGIRWKSSFDDSNPGGQAIAAFLFHIGHGVFLGAGLWTMLDPPFSPRFLPDQFGPGLSWLPLYYLVALSVGYYSGYFLLVFGKKKKRSQRESLFASLVNIGVQSAIWLLLIAAPAGLIYKNLPQIRAKTRPTLSALATRLTKSLPKRDLVLLSDDARLLSLTEAALNRHGINHAQILINTAGLPFPAYHRFLVAKYPQLRQDALGTNQPMAKIDPLRVTQFLARLAQSPGVYYLHPSFGYFFEHFYLEPHGLVYQLKLFPSNAVFNPPALTLDRVSENLNFWKQLDADTLVPLVQRERFLKKAHLRREPDLQAQLAGNYYSRALDWWGVELQKLGQLESAGWCFQRAQDVNPDNVVARINADYNQILRAGGTTPQPLPQTITDQLRHYRDWSQALATHGPCDEPRFCYVQGVVGLYPNGLYRQAAQQFDRARQLMPDNWNAHLGLAQVYNLWRMPDKAMEILRLVHTQSDLSANTTINQIQLSCIEAMTYFLKNDPQTSEQILETALAAHPDDEKLLNTSLQLYLTFQRYTNALAIIERLLQRRPDDPNLLNSKGCAYIQLKQYAAAIPPLDHALALQSSNHVARLNRAFAYLCNDHLDAARQDYEVLQKALPPAYQVYFGLGEIAYRKKERAAAIRYYQLYLTNAPPNTEERKLVNTRLAELKSGSP